MACSSTADDASPEAPPAADAAPVSQSEGQPGDGAVAEFDASTPEPPANVGDASPDSTATADGDTPECSDDADCEQGQSCSAGTCQPPACEPNRKYCGGDLLYSCDADSRVWLEQACLDAGCEEVGDTARCTCSTPLVTLVIDGSGSMCADFGGQPRWDAVRAAVLDASQGLVARHPSVSVGSALFWAPADAFLSLEATTMMPQPPVANCTVPPPVNGSCPELAFVPPRLDNLGALLTALPETLPGGSTPSGRALDAVLNTLTQGSQQANAHHLILLTDGFPSDVCPGDSGDVVLAQQRLLAAAQRAAAAGILLSVINLAPDYPELAPYLDQVAQQGDPNNKDAAAALPQDGAALAAALDAALDHGRACP